MKGGAFGWQTSLADLSLILFMLAAAALNDKPRDRAEPSGESTHASALSEPLAVYEATSEAPPLRPWLDQQAVDPRQQLTITARYGQAPGAREAALREAAQLLAQAGRAGRAARIVIEPGAGPTRVALAYDTPNGTPLAQ